jgi:hypothetical protein
MTVALCNPTTSRCCVQQAFVEDDVLPLHKNIGFKHWFSMVPDGGMNDAKHSPVGKYVITDGRVKHLTGKIAPITRDCLYSGLIFCSFILSHIFKALLKRDLKCATKALPMIKKMDLECLKRQVQGRLANCIDHSAGTALADCLINFFRDVKMVNRIIRSGIFSDCVYPQRESFRDIVRCSCRADVIFYWDREIMIE